jgi:hypothetical protein
MRIDPIPKDIELSKIPKGIIFHLDTTCIPDRDIQYLGFFSMVRVAMKNWTTQ